MTCPWGRTILLWDDCVTNCIKVPHNWFISLFCKIRHRAVTSSPALLIRMSNLGSLFRKFSAKRRTDFRLARSSCMNTTWLFPLSCRTLMLVRGVTGHSRSVHTELNKASVSGSPPCWPLQSSLNLLCGCQKQQPRLSPCCGRPGSPWLLSSPDPKPWPCRCQCCFLRGGNSSSKWRLTTIGCDGLSYLVNAHSLNNK